MNKEKKYFIISCILVAIWMVVIFSFSSQPSEESGALSGGIVAAILKFFGVNVWDPANKELVSFWDFLIRKTAHFTEYAILGMLLVNTFKIKKIDRYFIYSLILGALYSVTDEVHQIFVPGRSCLIKDMLLDSSGVLFGVSIATLIIRHHIKRRMKNESLGEKC